MKTYKFYTPEALLIEGYHVFDNDNEYVVTTSLGYSTADEPLARHLKSNEHFEIFDGNMAWMSGLIKEIGQNAMRPYDMHALAAAWAYDTIEHPDETVFVTARAQDVPIINKYFGEDSIIVVGEQKK